MHEIPIFDCITHPTLDGNWLSKKYDSEADVNKLICSMKKNNIQWAFAVGMKGIGKYTDKEYINLVSPYKELLPIAFFDFDGIYCISDIENKLNVLKNMGYIGVKIHPRLSNIDLNNEYLVHIVRKCNEKKMAVLFCTYFYDTKENSHNNNITNLIKFLNQIKDQKIVLLHSGSVRLLELMEIARANKNILLDLSFTICKYEGSSLDLDIRHMFKFFDRRICIGSDHPEFTHEKLRERFTYFSKDIPLNKLENIAYGNLVEYLSLLS